jgi:hypothetical protein
VLASPTTYVLETVRHAPSGQPAQSLQREWRAGAVASEPLATEVVARLDPHACVQVEAVALDCDGGPVRALFLVVTTGVTRALARERCDAAASHGDGSAALDRRLGGDLV